MNRKKYTYTEVKEYIENLGYILISETYISVKHNLILSDLDGYYYLISFDNFKYSNAPAKFYKRNPYTLQNIQLWCKLNNKSFELLGGQEYKGSDKKLRWKCLDKKCSEEFRMDWDCILQNYGCPYCTGKQVGLSNCLATKNPELAKEWHPTLNGNLTPWNVTVNSGKDVWWQCSKNPKHFWKVCIANRNTLSNDCPYCSGHLPSEDNNLLINNPVLCEEWDYNKNKKRPEEYCPHAREKVWWKCKECGHEWKAHIFSRNSNLKVGCPQCAESKGEKQLDIILTQFSIPHNSQYTFDDLIGTGGGLLRFDVSVFWDIEKTKLRMLIEYDGKQHFEWVKGFYTKEDFIKIQYHDKLKNKYCQNSNIKLLRIPYWDFDNIETIILRELNLMEEMVI